MVGLLGRREPVEAHAVARPVAIHLDALALVEGDLGLYLPGLGSRHPKRDDEDAQVDDEAAIAPVLPEQEPPGGGAPPVAAPPARANGAAIVERDGTGHEDHEGHGREHEDIAHPEESQDGRGHDAGQDRLEEVALEVLGGRAAPGNERAHAHEKEQGQEDRDVHEVEEGRAHADLDAAHGFREQREDRPEEDGEGGGEEKEVVQEKDGLAGDG